MTSVCFMDIHQQDESSVSALTIETTEQTNKQTNDKYLWGPKIDKFT